MPFWWLCEIVLAWTSKVEASFLAQINVFREPSRDVQRYVSWSSQVLAGKINGCLIMYWGVGRKIRTGLPEESALQFLDIWIKGILDGFDVPINRIAIITDTHAEINGVSIIGANSYISDSENVLKKFGWSTVKMSRLLGDPGVQSGLSYIKAWEEEQVNHKKELEKLAAIHSNNVDPAEAARDYYIQNRIESKVLSELYPEAVMVTYNSSMFDFLLPRLPKIHVFVGPKKYVKRPWFDSEVR